MENLKFNFVYDRKHVAKAGKPGTVEIRFTFNRRQKYISTGVKVCPNEWDYQKGTVIRHPEKNELNQRLMAIHAKASKIVSRTYNDENIDFDSIIRQFQGKSESKTIDFPTYCERRTEARCVCEHTKARYRVFTRFLRSWGRIRSFADITVASIRAMDEYLHARGIGQASVYNYHKYLKLFTNDAVIDGYIQDNPYRRLPFKILRGDKQYVDCLTTDQFEKIRSIVISSPHLARVRDLFLFQCYTGLAYSDLMAFDFAECVLVDGKYFYHKKRVKTSVDFVLQLLTPAVDILAKYGNVLPRISNQKYNDYLKVIGAMIDVPNLHSHMGRATAATQFLSNGMPINVVSKVLGHTNLRQTQRYAQTLSRDVRNAFDFIDSKMSSK